MAETTLLNWGDIDEGSSQPEEIDGVLYLTFPYTGELSHKLVDRLEENYLATGHIFTKMLAVNRGAHPVASVVSERIGMANHQFVHMNVQSYGGTVQTEPGKLWTPRILPSREEFQDEDFLQVGEVWETGHSDHFVRRYALANKAASCLVATLFFKPGRNAILGGRPHLYLEEYDGWIDFPWERERRRAEPVVGLVGDNRPPIQVDPDKYIRGLTLLNDLSPEETAELDIYQPLSS